MRAEAHSHDVNRPTHEHRPPIHLAASRHIGQAGLPFMVAERSVQRYMSELTVGPIGHGKLGVPHCIPRRRRMTARDKNLRFLQPPPVISVLQHSVYSEPQAQPAAIAPSSIPPPTERCAAVVFSLISRTYSPLRGSLVATERERDRMKRNRNPRKRAVEYEQSERPAGRAAGPPPTTR